MATAAAALVQVRRQKMRAREYDRSSYLSQISQIIFVEKNLSCGEISDFCKEFKKKLWSFNEIYAVFILDLCGEKSVWRKNYKYEV